MSKPDFKPVAALDVPPRAKASNYPEPFASRMAGRVKRQLGDAFGIAPFGVNLTILRPGAQSSLLHRHSQQHEFVYVLSGHPTLRTDQGEFPLQPGMCAGFVPGGCAHHLVNATDQDVTYLEVGDRNPEDRGAYPEDDLDAVWTGDSWRFTHKDGSAY
ncbi:cupin domain-containing protein [Zavarzinia sp. CC-PAN008]|uniref:cupin domain-containing protein n=1 Tax=Zavarzinia sp. CC-PAN008 TaxID=3243332 RepID=UPI003F7460D2